MKIVKYNDLDNIVHRLQPTYDEFIDVLDLKKFTGSTKLYTLPPGVYKILDIKFILKCSLRKRVEVIITIDDVNLKSHLTTDKTIRFTKKLFFYMILVLIQSHSGELGDIPSFVQLIPGTYKSDKPIKITAFDKVH